MEKAQSNCKVCRGAYFLISQLQGVGAILVTVELWRLRGVLEAVTREDDKFDCSRLLNWWFW